jgi:hypothetical protein
MPIYLQVNQGTWGHYNYRASRCKAAAAAVIAREDNRIMIMHHLFSGKGHPLHANTAAL